MKSMSKLFGLSLIGLVAATTGEARGVKAQPVPSAPTAPPANTTAYDRAPWWMKENVIAQTGFVYTEIPANRAWFSATFLSVDTTVDKAQSKAIAQVKALNQALDKLGKDAVRVNTTFSMRALYEEYRDKNGNRVEDQRGDKITGYQVSLNLSLQVRDMSVLENAYALVLAAAPTQTTDVSFSLQPSNEANSWLYNQAVKDAHKRAQDAAEAAGGHLGAIKVIDPTGRACRSDILARNAEEGFSNQANRVDYDEPVSSPMSYKRSASVSSAPPPPAPPAPGTAEYLEAKALANSFIQTPPPQRLETTACVVYGVN
ncbi:MAG TPA: SIMPL domain-containing protein [Asticcacaulis sp.]|nr:SIMPL domain-containing protein [Asticcacaulis sp.]